MKDNYFKISLFITFSIVIFLLYKKGKDIMKRKNDLQLSKNFWLSEFEKSEKADEYNIDNSVPPEKIPNIKELVRQVLQPARNFLGQSINISSGYRNPRLNILIGGSATSDHPKGKAADLKTYDNKKLFFWIRDNLEFDQLIWEYGDKNQPEWVHVSYRGDGKNRNEVLYFKN